MQRSGDRCGSTSSLLQSGLGILVSYVPLDTVQLTDQLNRLAGDLALVGSMQLDELTACMCHATHFDDTLVEQRLVAAEVVAHQAAGPG